MFTQNVTLAGCPPHLPRCGRALPHAACFPPLDTYSAQDRHKRSVQPWFRENCFGCVQAVLGEAAQAMEGGKAKAESLTAAQAVKLRARQFTAAAGDKFKVASASISRGDTQVCLRQEAHNSTPDLMRLFTGALAGVCLLAPAAADTCSIVVVGAPLYMGASVLPLWEPAVSYGGLMGLL